MLNNCICGELIHWYTINIRTLSKAITENRYKPCSCSPFSALVTGESNDELSPIFATSTFT